LDRTITTDEEEEVNGEKHSNGSVVVKSKAEDRT